MVDERAKAEGYTVGPVWHGSGAKFNVFSLDNLGLRGRAEGSGFYFTDDKQVAKGYARKDGYLYRTYLKLENPARYDEQGLRGDVLKDTLWRIAEIEHEYDP